MAQAKLDYVYMSMYEITYAEVKKIIRCIIEVKNIAEQFLVWQS